MSGGFIVKLNVIYVMLFTIECIINHLLRFCKGLQKVFVPNVYRLTAECL